MEKNTLRHLIRDASKSKTLDLSSCNLADIPMEVLRISGLKRLVLSNNKIVSIPKEIAALESLEYLDISGNQIRELPAALAAGNQNKIINASYNRLHHVDYELCVLNWIHIRLTGNPQLLITDPSAPNRSPTSGQRVAMESMPPHSISTALRILLQELNKRNEEEDPEKDKKREERILANKLKRVMRSEKDRLHSAQKNSGRSCDKL